MKGVVIGAGDRGGHAYPSYLRKRPDQARLVAVAEPVEARRNAFARRYELPPEGVFEDYRELLDRPRLADFALIATPDPLHREPALRALERGYHVLLEKPMAQTEADCRELVTAAEDSGRILQVCHVLRYAPFFRTLKQIVTSGELGQIVTIQHSENVSYWHYAHSYCRGNWRNSSESSPMILAKSCHDLDILYWLAEADPVRLTSLARPNELCEEEQAGGRTRVLHRRLPSCRPLPVRSDGHVSRAAPDAVGSAEDPEATPDSRAHPALSEVPRHPSEAPRLGRAEARTQGGLADLRRDQRSLPSGDSSRAPHHAIRTLCLPGGRQRPGIFTGSEPSLRQRSQCGSFTMHSTSHREGREIRVDGTRGSASGRLLQRRADPRGERITRPGGRGAIHFPVVSAIPTAAAITACSPAFWPPCAARPKPATSASQSLQSHLMAFAADRAQTRRERSWSSPRRRSRPRANNDFSCEGTEIRYTHSLLRGGEQRLARLRVATRREIRTQVIY